MEKQFNLLGKMVTDTSYVNQPKGTTTFVLNGVNETEDGNLSNRFSEESNIDYFPVPEGFIPLGKTTISNNESATFYGNGFDSLIIVTHKDKPNSSEIVFDDRGQDEKMGFSIFKQVDVLFRLRRGCERTLYWVDPKPRQFNIDRPEKYKNSLGEWDIKIFSLQRRPKTYPTYNSVTVLNSGGSLLSGSYNILIQYLDEDFNPSEILSPTEVMHIYADNTQRNHREIRGSSNVGNSYYNLEVTTKSIKIVINNLDITYPFYRVVVAEATSGTGLVNAVKYSNEISTSNNTFIYTGSNFSSEGSTEELLEIQDYIEEAGHIEQLDNMLILSETKGSSIPFCNLQKYFSRALVDMQAKTVFLSENIGANSKNPLAKLEGLGYMPREIYSIGAVVVFENNVQSPVYHIPGKSNTLPQDLVFAPDEDVYPMDINNTSQTDAYTDNGDCEDYWGKDAHGNTLLGTPIRHHRFPSRASVNLPLFEEVENDSNIETGQLVIKISISGVLELPECPVEDPNCDFDTLLESVEDILFEVIYEDENGVSYTFVEGITYFSWNEDETYGQISFTPAVSSGLLTVISIREIVGETITNVTSGDPSEETSLSYTTEVIASTFTTKNRVSRTKVMGFKFSNIDIPTIQETAGAKVIGIFFVRNERTEDQMTVVDTGVLVPCLQNNNFISQGLLCPELPSQLDPRLNKNYFGLINPRFKFDGTTYDTFSSIERDGSFQITQRNKSRFRVEDIFDGSTYTKKRHKRSERDDDGWDLHVRTRHNETAFNFTGQGTFAQGADIEDVFYLPALASKLVDVGNIKKEIFNLASDNRIGFIQKADAYNQSFLTNLPYVSLIIENSNPYSNFRSSAYYKIHENFFPVDNEDTSLSFTVFGGDTYVTPMAYTNSVFYEDKARRRRTKSGVLAIIGAIVLTVLAVLVAIGTFGTGIVISAALISAAAGLVATLAISGITQETYNRVYRVLYNKGLRKTVLDEFTELFKNTNPIDDEFQWIGDSVDLWFETTVNTGLRQGSNNSIITDFIDAPTLSETGNSIPLTGLNTVPPITALDNHMQNKLTYFDFERKKSNKAYFGYAQAEVYDLNSDYIRFNRQKAYFALPIEYDCCSDCTEDFPHRVHYSLQSFDEELTDNYKIFLPNNYKDIEGHTGKITDMFRMGNNLYIHTQHALWHLPQNFQERVTGEILSFIGTGDYFSLPPRKIVDDQNNSAGTQHKWGRVKTPYGVSFPSSIEGVWFLFNGESLQLLSDAGMSNDFRNMMIFQREVTHTSPLNTPFMFGDNPSNPLGVGFVSVYDTEKKRLILTKKDNVFKNNLDSEYCFGEIGLVEFQNIVQTIADMAEEGWEYIGIENCKLKFRRLVTTESVATGSVRSQVPNDAFVYVFPDFSGSFNKTQREALVDAVTQWYEGFRPEDVGNTKLILMPQTPDTSDSESERWVRFPKYIVSRPEFSGKALIISLINEAHPLYHGTSVLYPLPAQPTPEFMEDFEEFVGTPSSTGIHTLFDFFMGVNYTISTGDISRPHIQQSILAINGENFTPTEIDSFPINSDFTNVTEINRLKDSMADNPYSTLGAKLKDFGWIGKYDRNDTAETSGAQDSIITPEQFAVDLNELLQAVTVEEDYEYDLAVDSYEYTFVHPDAILDYTDLFEDKSWTISYSLKEQGFISYHSWTPSFYLGETNAFFSWPQYGTYLYKHNRKGKFLNFYGVSHSFIIERVENQSVVAEKISDFITWQTVVERYDSFSGEYIQNKDLTFNKLLVYNSYQISGVLTLQTKIQNSNYISQQITQQVDTIIIDRNERNWTANNLRDIRVNMALPMFTKDPVSMPSSFIDKVVNSNAINFNRPWYEAEPFTDKFLVVRYIFDSFVMESNQYRIGIHFDNVDIKPSER